MSAATLDIEQAAQSAQWDDSPETERIVLDGIRWETYIALSDDYTDRPGYRFTYDNGTLEIMTVAARHEKPNRALATLVQIIAEERGMDFVNLGSTTFRRKDLRKGFEPDTCFYFENTELMREKDEVDPRVDPPPNLIIEIDNTRSSKRRFPLFAAFGITEVWRHHRGTVQFFGLHAGGYSEMTQSAVLPEVRPELVTGFLELAGGRNLRTG